MDERQIESRLAFLERRMATADPKDLPSLNSAYQRLFDMLARMDRGPDANLQK